MKFIHQLYRQSSKTYENKHLHKAVVVKDASNAVPQCDKYI